eukprot:UN02043
MSLSALKKDADILNHFLVFGFIRKIEKKRMKIMSDTVIDLCLLYYGVKCNDYFKVYDQDQFEMSNDKHTIKSGSYYLSGSCYGDKEIPSVIQAVCTWKFKINKSSYWHGMGKKNIAIGITETRKKKCRTHNEMFCSSKNAKDTKFYAYWTDGAKVAWNILNRTYVHQECNIDEISMELHLKRGALSIIVDGKQINCFDNIVQDITIHYCVAVYLHSKSNIVSLLGYTMKYN